MEWKFWLDQPRHLSFIFCRFMSSRPEAHEILLARFAAKVGLDPESVEQVFRDEEEEHFQRECLFPDCQRGFEREAREWARAAARVRAGSGDVVPVPPHTPPKGGREPREPEPLGEKRRKRVKRSTKPQHELF